MQLKRLNLLRTGVIGSIAAALLCLTPVLAWLFVGLGLSATLGWIDWVLWLVFGGFLVMTAYALWLRRKRR